MPSNVQRFAQQQRERLAEAAKHVPELPEAVVQSIMSGGGSDGQALVTVTYNGATLAFPHMAHYTPVVGDVVALVRWSGQWVIAGKPVGFP